MNIDADGEKESPDERNEVRGVNEAGTSGAGSGLQGTTSSLRLQQKQIQSQSTTVCWARFLHVESIRVLLVENDDSTRHIVTALLRNCNYEVIGASNGIQAWKILEDLNNRVDLVLTEVVMPFLPGIPLLSKIMSHKTRKNVPVIMMSSHDSMGLVFKCLSKGAVDFLVKPIRKNELKNLWQHVWRRCHSSSGSGSESGTQTQKSVKSKSSDKSDNSGSDDAENDMSNGLNGVDGSDDGSGTQSSWTKQAVEVESSQALSPIDQIAECQDSTCAQVIRSNAENSSHMGLHVSAAMGDPKQEPDNITEGNGLEAAAPRHVESKVKYPMDNPAGSGSTLKPFVELERKTSVNQKNMGQDNTSAECPFNRHKASIYETSNFLIDGKDFGSTREVTSNLEINYYKEPNLELSLKRLRGDPDTERSSQEERFVLRRSEQSAFSRYNTSPIIFKPPNGNTGCSSMIDKRPDVAKLESVRGTRGHSTDHRVHPKSNGVINNLDMGSTTNKLPKHPCSVKDESETTSTINGLHPSTIKPVTHDVRYGPPQGSLFLHGEIQATDLSDPQRDLQIQHPHRNNNHRNHNHHRSHNLEQQPSPNNGESPSKKLVVDTPPHCGSTNAVGEAMDSNPKDYSLNRSASGSNHVSNVQNGSSNAVNAAGANPESDAGQAGKSGSGDASGSGSGNKIDEDKIARRIAALSKFRQKKKDRCFAKKVRYHNRKKLAEQRPRVRGQFVKQTGTDSSNKNSDE